MFLIAAVRWAGAGCSSPCSRWAWAWACWSWDGFTCEGERKGEDVGGGWRLVDGDWWMEIGGWRLVDGDWWMVIGG